MVNAFTTGTTYCRRPTVFEIADLARCLEQRQQAPAPPRTAGHDVPSTFKATAMPVTITVADARALPTAPSLGVEGFQLVGSPLDASFGHADERLRDDAFVRRAYYPLMERLLCGLTGAARCVCAHHRMRTNDPGVLQAGPQVAEGPAPVVHADYSHDESLHILSKVAAMAPGKWVRAMIVNCWRNIDAQDRPVRNHHLAMCDARSVAAPDDITDNYAIRDEERISSGYSLLPEAVHRHRWLHFPAMRRDEAVAFVQFDSSVAPSPVDGGPRPRYVFHTSVADPAAPAGVVRKSMELRAVLFFEHPAHPADRMPVLRESCLGYTAAQQPLDPAVDACARGLIAISLRANTFEADHVAGIRRALAIPFSMAHGALINGFIERGVLDGWLNGCHGASAERKKALIAALKHRFDSDKALRKEFIDNLKWGCNC